MSTSAFAQAYPGEELREELRRLHGVRLVQGEEDGLGVHRQPEGVYGFTYSPGIKDTPLFSWRGEFTFEVMKIKGGEVLLTGFVKLELAATIRAGQECEVDLYPAPREGATEHVALPMSRVHRVKDHSSRDGGALHMKLDAR